MDYWEHYNQLNLHTKSNISNAWKDNLCLSYKLKNLFYNESSLTHTIIIKKNLQLTFQFQPDKCQFKVNFYWGMVFRKKVYSFNLKLTQNDVVFLKNIKVVTDENSRLDFLSKYITKVVNDCPFVYAQKAELKYLNRNDVTDFYGFKRNTVNFSLNNDRDTQTFRCYMTEDKNYKSSHDYHLYCNQLRRIYKNNGFDLVDAPMQIKQKLVKVPYFVSKRINHDDWFLIADFYNEGTGFLACNHGKYIYVLKHNEYTQLVKGTDKEFSLKELLSNYSLDYFKFNKTLNKEKIDIIFSEFGLDANNLTEKDFEAYSMYDY